MPELSLGPCCIILRPSHLKTQSHSHSSFFERCRPPSASKTGLERILVIAPHHRMYNTAFNLSLLPGLPSDLRLRPVLSSPPPPPAPSRTVEAQHAIAERSQLPHIVIYWRRTHRFGLQRVCSLKDLSLSISFETLHASNKCLTRRR